MNKYQVLIVIGLCHLVIVGCHGPDKTTGPTGPDVTPRVREQARVALVNWLECEECEDGELDNVLEYSELLRPSLVATLKAGPPEAGRERLRLHLSKTYRELEDYGRSHPEARLSSKGQSEYVHMYMGNYVAQYKVRAAAALGRIGGTEARESLQKARRSAEREDVKIACQQALQR